MSSAATVAGPQTAPRTVILGTAGHIDHGKSSLVRALTGTDPDRLPEEQRRGMTIELGFAHLPIGAMEGRPALEVGIVDVPGHERFVRTMVAGATGVDLGMLVVACDDGVMPQTREHVEILDLLGVETGLVALSKADLVDDGRVAEVSATTRALLRGTALADWPLVACSAKSGRGLDEIRATVSRLAAGRATRGRGSIFRLAIDRVFTVHGRGTVVTGSVLSGRATVGAALELMPGRAACKVREIQSHGSAAAQVGAGQRAALNLTGVDREQIERGMELATPGYLTPSRYLDARVRMIGRLDKPVPSHRRVRLSIGTTEEMAMLVVVGGKQIDPGGEALVQLRLARPMVASFGQRFILRDETAQATLGGGRIVRPIARRVRASQPEERDALARSDAAEPFERFVEAMRRAGFETPADLRIACEIGVGQVEVPALRQRLDSNGAMIDLGGGRRVHRETVEAVESRAVAYLRRHHAAQPNEPGILRDRLVGWVDKRSAAGCGRWIVERLEKAGRIKPSGPFLAHAEFRPALSPEDAALLERLIAEIGAARFDPPAMAALKTVAGLSKQRAKVLEDLAKAEPRLTGVGPGQYLTTAAFNEFKAAVVKVGTGRKFKLAEVRDALGLNRRVVQLLLEHLDRIRFTRRVGDERVLVEAGA